MLVDVEAESLNIDPEKLAEVLESLNDGRGKLPPVVEEEMLKGGDWEKVYRDEVLPSKLAIDLEYFAHRTLMSDLRLIFRTISSMAK